MKTSNSNREARELTGIVHMARLRLAGAESNVNTAKARARVAKRRRKEAKQAARRAKQLVKRAKAELVEAKQALAEAQKNLARKSEQTTRTGASIRARRKAKASARMPKEKKKAAPVRKLGQGRSSRPGTSAPATSPIPIVPKSGAAEPGAVLRSDTEARAIPTQPMAARPEEDAERNQQTQ